MQIRGPQPPSSNSLDTPDNTPEPLTEIEASGENRPALWQRWLEKEHLGFAITLGYLFLASVGMLHRAVVLLHFRINVFDYAEPSDFVVAALRDPLIVIATIAPLPLVWGYFRGARWLQKRFPPRSRSAASIRSRELMDKYRSSLFALTVVLWSVAFSLHYANRAADHLRAGEGRRIQVELVAGSLRAADDTAAFLLIGTTQKFVFLYDDRSSVTTVVPSSNISRIRYDRKR